MNVNSYLKNTSIILCFVFACACQIIWTDFEFINLSSSHLYVKVYGVDPDPSPGNMPPGTDGDGARAGTHFGDPVAFKDPVKIVWTVDSNKEKNEQVIKLRDLGVSSKIHGGKIKAVYTTDGKWEVKYLRKGD